jgi:hypothetical protein
VPAAQAAHESWWLHEPGHTDAARRVSLSSYGGGNVLNEANPAVDNWFKNYAHANYNSYDALMMDDTTGSLSDELFGSGSALSDELTSDAVLQAAHKDMAAVMTHTSGQPFLQIDNALTPNPYLATPFKMLNSPSTVNGLIAEGAPMSDGTLTSYYSTLLDEMAYVDHTSNDFIALLSYDRSGSLRARLVQEATVLVGYSAGHTVDWSDLEQNSSDLAVWPEEGIVPTNPVQTMDAPRGADCLAGQGIVCSSGGHNNLEVAPGVYRREFGQCYDRGVAFGDCATIINTTGSPVTIKSSWLTDSYDHQMTMKGGDVQTGGTLNLAGARFTAGTTTVVADDAMLLTSGS